MEKRKSQIKRKTRETDIKLGLVLEGKGAGRIDSGIGFFDHMLELFSRQGLFDLTLSARGDLKTGYHHTVEDIGICLGQAFVKALGSKRGIRRYGEATIPMDEALASVTVDISGRSFLVYHVKVRRIKIADFNVGLVKEFFRAFSDQADLALHINLHYGEDIHHCLEAIFKAFGRALRQAAEKDPRVKGIPSTKGKL